MYKILFDVMGYENPLSHAINAARNFVKKHPEVEITLVGDEQLIRPLFTSQNEFPILHANEFISQDDSVLSIRHKRDSSLSMAFKKLKDDSSYQGLLSAANSAVFVYYAYSIIGLIDHIKKPAFMPFVPTVDGVGLNLLDVGASIEVDEYDLLNYAIMAKVIAAKRVTNPVVKILNIASEEIKGNALVKKANALFKEHDKELNLNYQGFIEPKTILEHPADVIVTDGFSGNLVLKSLEGTAKTLTSFLKQEYKKKRHCLAALFSIPIFKKMKSFFDYRNTAGAFVLGTKSILVKAHGSADEKQFSASLNVLYDNIKNNALEEITENLKRFYDQREHE
ncbi:phosphate acyltransferase PlsX [Ureaplasma miroungigenitalium]|uniref:Phosphate acyltransferase n=1 Tax=Ureaplasma miroungigenitalium TaxID=1042321 RepID=A0ABT3BML3_9BACT|nr:phosphate acyltransferase PlsX [Ureaplasma miroungigenitalium]MCV3728462.1 phosphate acyltransferase PlsX [Ureaplasma miroungigenitalium]MCV3734249.1 phosphate acyltransferase PlsX [Ureaplasma miroungigenitalium]